MNKDNTKGWNTGDCNTGNYNTGHRNAGDSNTGYWNTGHRNTGYYNTGDLNTGNRNTGYWNTGNYNTGDLNTTKPPTVRLFNQDSGWEFYGENHLRLQSILRKYSQAPTEWISDEKMSSEEKEANPTYKTTGGYLKVFTSNYNGKPVNKEDREFLESVPNFCPNILKECTGIVLDQKRTIVIDGKEIEISEESYQAFKKQFER